MNFKRKILSLLGWHTNRKIIVFESDDWGSIRMPDKSTLSFLSKNNSQLCKDYYSQLDTIARKKDLEDLFEILMQFKDSNNNYPVITANTIVANPDFDFIKQSDFRSYKYERFDETILRLDEGVDILRLWKKGQDQKIFKPQLHGREHLNIPLWLKELQLGNKDLLDAFDKKCFSVPYTKIFNHKRKNLMASLDYAQIPNEKEYQKKYILEAADIFHGYFRFKSSSFIAPAYIWHPEIESILKQSGVDFLQGLPIQLVPNNKSRFSKKFHYLGQKNSKKQYYLVRNAFFEPSSDNNVDWAKKALKRIDFAFRTKKPAIIGVHRVNFIGSLLERNRESNLKEFFILLQQILKLWPDVEFMSSDELGNLILQSDKK